MAASIAHSRSRPAPRRGSDRQLAPPARSRLPRRCAGRPAGLPWVASLTESSSQRGSHLRHAPARGLRQYRASGPVNRHIEEPPERGRYAHTRLLSFDASLIPRLAILAAPRLARHCIRALLNSWRWQACNVLSLPPHPTIRRSDWWASNGSVAGAASTSLYGSSPSARIQPSPAFISTATRVFQLRTGGTTQLKGANELDTACSIVARRVTLSSLRSSNAQGRGSHPVFDLRQSFATEPAPR